MTPGLALFYGGMVRTKSVLNMMMMSLRRHGHGRHRSGCCGATARRSATTSAAASRQPLRSTSASRASRCDLRLRPGGCGHDAAGGIPGAAFVAFQVVFAIITVALISGAIADRAKFGTWMVFTVVWATLVYFPVGPLGLRLRRLRGRDRRLDRQQGRGFSATRRIDFAGGTAVHINAGAAGLALALVLGKRIGFGKEPMRPHNLTLVMLGAGLLWFGWFGFNAGSALGADGTAAVGVWVNTLAATCAAMLGWLARGEDPRRPRHLARRRLRCRRRPGRHHPGLRAPSRPLGAIVLGVVAGAVCALRSA